MTHLIVGLRQQLCLRVVRHGDIVRQKIRSAGIHHGGHLPERTHKEPGEIEGNHDDQKHHNDLNDQHRLRQIPSGQNNIGCRNRYDKSSDDILRHIIGDRADNLDKVVLRDIVIRIFSLETLDQFLGTNGFSVIYGSTTSELPLSRYPASIMSALSRLH